MSIDKVCPLCHQLYPVAWFEGQFCTFCAEFKAKQSTLSLLPNYGREYCGENLEIITSCKQRIFAGRDYKQGEKDAAEHFRHCDYCQMRAYRADRKAEIVAKVMREEA